jgi:D-alanine transaminase
MDNGLAYIRNGHRSRGAFLPLQEICVSPSDRGFVFGDGIYEVVRSYESRLFRLADHMKRLERSLQGARIGFGSAATLEPIMRELLDRNGCSTADAMIYLQITRGEAPRAHPFPHPPVEPTVYMAISQAAECSKEQAHGVAVETLSDFRWTRCDIKSIALQANVLAIQHARDHDAYECVFVRDGVFTEGTHTNFFAVLDGVVRTHPEGNLILSGITRACVLELCREAGVPFVEAPVAELDLERIEEAFLTATSCEVTPIVRMSGRTVGTGRPGPVTQQLQKLFRELTLAS